LRKAPEGYTHLLVAIDKFSKWVEVRPITNLRAEQAVTFFTDIIYRFGVPNSIITDNGSQFMGRNFLESCDKFHIRRRVRGRHTSSTPSPIECEAERTL
jgi:hypothetical protein